MACLDSREPALCAAHSAPPGRWWVTALIFSCHSLGWSLALKVIGASCRTYCTALSGGRKDNFCYPGRVTSVLLHRNHSCTQKPLLIAF